MLTLLGMLFFSSCKREFLESIQSAEDNAQIETEFSQIFETVADLLLQTDVLPRPMTFFCQAVLLLRLPTLFLMMVTALISK